MKVSPLVLMLAAALVGALSWGTCSAGRASKAEIRLAARLHQDSINNAVHVARQDSLRRELDALRADSALLAQRYQAVRRFVPAANDSIQRLLALLPDSSRRSLEPAVAVLRESGEACQASLDNCEQLATNAEARAMGDAKRVVELLNLSHEMEDAWRAAERKAKPSFLRDLYRSRTVTLPLMALSAFLILDRR